MAALTLVHLADTGAKPATQNSSASDTADYGNSHNTFLVYKNTGGSASVVTITPTAKTSYNVLLPAQVFTVPATTGEFWIPLRKEYDDGTGGGTVTVTATNVGATLQVALVRVDF